jgi:hypothetical protein
MVYGVTEWKSGGRGQNKGGGGREREKGENGKEREAGGGRGKRRRGEEEEKLVPKVWIQVNS